MKVEYLGHFGDDLMVVDAARVSFDKKSSWEIPFDQGGFGDPEPRLSERDVKLIRHLASKGHWTPFAHPQLQLRMTVPIFIANQLKRSTVGFALNEVSRRYVDDEPTFYTPEEWRGRPPKSIKQGSSDEVITVLEERVFLVAGFDGCAIEDEDGIFQTKCSGDIHLLYKDHIEDSISLYEDMLKAGVAPEMARMVLPQSMYTSWIWTGSLAAFVRVYKQRKDAHAQKESQLIADEIGKILKQSFPVSFEALTTDWSQK